MALADHMTIGEWRGRLERFRNDQIIVSVQSSVPARDIEGTITDAIGRISGASVRSLRQGRRWAIVGLQQGTDIAAAAIMVASRPGIRYAEPDFALFGHTRPSDVRFAEQGWPETINMEDAWEIGQGNDSVLLAVFDSGIEIDDSEFAHDDLKDPGYEDLDAGGRFIARHRDSGGSVVDHDYVDEDDTPEDAHGHGTWITGILAAEANNDADEGDPAAGSVAGVNWHSPVYIARVLDGDIKLLDPKEVDDGGTITYVSIVKLAMDDLILYAATNKYERVVVNMSFGSAHPDYKEATISTRLEREMESLEEMCEETEAVEVSAELTCHFILCCAPGFVTQSGLPNVADYPARYAVQFDHVISVGSTDETDTIKAPSTGNEPDDELEVTVLAPGNGVGCTTLLGNEYGAPSQSGTSLAAPMVAGVVSLMWSANPGASPAVIKQCLRNTGFEIKRGDRTYRRLDAGRAVRSATLSITLETPRLAFIDVAVGTSTDLDIVMSVECCANLTFRVKSTSMDAAFSIAPEADEMSYDPATSAGVVSGIPITYRAGAAGSVAFGKVEIECEQTLETWTVYLTANTAGALAIVVAFVADKSGSMSQSSGIGDLTRMDVLKEALAISIETLQSGDGCAVVSFDTDAATVQPLLEITSNDAHASERDPLYAAVSGLAPGGGTSIGDGVRLGSTLLPSTSDRNRAILVVTDGHENTAEYIADVIDEIDVPVYAIGMGTAEVIQLESLERLTTGTGGYVELTDTLDEGNRYLVAKYCLQMLSSISGSDLIVDPASRIQPGHQIDVPFWISDQDYSCDVITLMPSAGLVDVALVAPTKDRIAAGHLPKGVAFRRGTYTCRYRIDLTAADRDSSGKWVARLSLSEDNRRAYGRKLKGQQRTRFEAHGASYCALVSCRSAIRMSVRTYITSGSGCGQVVLRAVTTERGLPVRHPPAVTAHIRHPDGTDVQMRVPRAGPGVNELEFDARMPGCYICSVRALGFTSRGKRYQREQVMTAHVSTRGIGAPLRAPATRGRQR